MSQERVVGEDFFTGRTWGCMAITPPKVECLTLAVMDIGQGPAASM